MELAERRALLGAATRYSRLCGAHARAGRQIALFHLYVFGRRGRRADTRIFIASRRVCARRGRKTAAAQNQRRRALLRSAREKRRRSARRKALSRQEKRPCEQGVLRVCRRVLHRRAARGNYHARRRQNVSRARGHARARRADLAPRRRTGRMGRQDLPPRACVCRQFEKRAVQAVLSAWKRACTALSARRNACLFSVV